MLPEYTPIHFISDIAAFPFDRGLGMRSQLNSSLSESLPASTYQSPQGIYHCITLGRHAFANLRRSRRIQRHPLHFTNTKRQEERRREEPVGGGSRDKPIYTDYKRDITRPDQSLIVKIIVLNALESQTRETARIVRPLSSRRC